MNGESNCLLVFGAGSVTKFHELVTSVICFLVIEPYSVISIITSNEPKNLVLGYFTALTMDGYSVGQSVI